jgi:hypothetical protein
VNSTFILHSFSVGKSIRGPCPQSGRKVVSVAKIKFPKTIAVTVDSNSEGPTDENLLAWKDVQSADEGRVAIYKLIDEVDTKTVTKIRKQGETEWFEA